jgi:hypothetical protein
LWLQGLAAKSSLQCNSSKSFIFDRILAGELLAEEWREKIAVLFLCQTFLCHLRPFLSPSLIKPATAEPEYELIWALNTGGGVVVSRS